MCSCRFLFVWVALICGVNGSWSVGVFFVGGGGCLVLVVVGLLLASFFGEFEGVVVDVDFCTGKFVEVVEVLRLALRCFEDVEVLRLALRCFEIVEDV